MKRQELEILSFKKGKCQKCENKLSLDSLLPNNFYGYICKDCFIVCDHEYIIKEFNEMINKSIPNKKPDVVKWLIG
jgi:hypothetical protein